MHTKDMVTIMGARGTAPVEGAEVARYGGATACVMVRLGGETVILDGGTGLLSLKQCLRPEEKTLHLLLSHPHFDHMIGLPACQVLFDPGYTAHLYAAAREGLSPVEQLQRLMEPPLWPVRPEDFTANMQYHAIEGDFQIGDLQVRVREGCHPGGCSLFRLEWGGKSVVYASDYELCEENFELLSCFARNCTLLLCDGQYNEAERVTHRGFGHSVWSDAARMAAACGAEKLRVLHHAPWRTDDELDRAGAALREIFNESAFAHGGEEIGL